MQRTFRVSQWKKMAKDILFRAQTVEFSLFQRKGYSSSNNRSKKSNNRSKKRLYYREHDLDHAIDLQKRPKSVLKLKDILLKQKGECLLLRDLEKEVGLIQKWNFIACIQNCPKIFKVSGGNRKPPLLEFTDEAKNLIKDEPLVKDLMEPLIVKNLTKLLMMSKERMVPLFKIEQIKQELGLAENFVESLIPKYQQNFRLKEICGSTYLVLEKWDPSLAVTAREVGANPNGIVLTRRTWIPRDGNFDGFNAFMIKYPVSMKPRMRQLEDMAKWQNMAFLSPYEQSKVGLDPRTLEAQKRAVGVVHEVLSLTLEKRLTFNQLDAFHTEYDLPTRFLACIIRHNGIFYMTNKGARCTVFLKEAYEGNNLVDKCPLLRYHDRFLKLMGRNDLASKRAPATIELKRVWTR